MKVDKAYRLGDSVCSEVEYPSVADAVVDHMLEVGGTFRLSITSEGTVCVSNASGWSWVTFSEHLPTFQCFEADTGRTYDVKAHNLVEAAKQVKGTAAVFEMFATVTFDFCVTVITPKGTE